MNNNATRNTQNNNHSVSDKHSDEGQCAIPWCVKHERYDVGHRHEGVIHVGRTRKVQHHTFWLTQDRMLREQRPGPVLFWLDGEEMTPARAKVLGQAIIDTAAGAV